MKRVYLETVDGVLMGRLSLGDEELDLTGSVSKWYGKFCDPATEEGSIALHGDRAKPIAGLRYQRWWQALDGSVVLRLMPTANTEPWVLVDGEPYPCPGPQGEKRLLMRITPAEEDDRFLVEVSLVDKATLLDLVASDFRVESGLLAFAASAASHPKQVRQQRPQPVPRPQQAKAHAAPLAQTPPAPMPAPQPNSGDMPTVHLRIAGAQGDGVDVPVKPESATG